MKYRNHNGAPGSLTKKGYSNPTTFIKNVSRLSAPSNDSQNGTRLGDNLELVQQIRNSVTIKTGEFEALTRIFTGQKMYVDTRDISLAPHLMLDGVWEEPLTKLLLNQPFVFFRLQHSYL